jgi:hypothetical protein
MRVKRVTQKILYNRVMVIVREMSPRFAETSTGKWYALAFAAHAHDYYQHRKGVAEGDSTQGPLALFDEADIARLIDTCTAAEVNLRKSVPKPVESESKSPDDRIFNVLSDGTARCHACLSDVSDVGAATYLYESDGWLAPCVCANCGYSIPVYVDLRA